MPSISDAALRPRGGTRLEVVVPLFPAVVAHGATVRLH